MAKNISFLTLSFLSLIFTFDTFGQEAKATFIDARELTLVGKIYHKGPFYHRLDTAAIPDLPKAVKVLATHAAGLAITFQTSSSKISAKWCTSSGVPTDNMTGLAFEGMDLYIKRNDRWQYAGVARPKSHNCNEAEIVANMAPGNKTCLLFLPTYDETISLQIGVDAGATISPATHPFKKNIVVYGSSIVQGASASRPGLSYPARLSRETGLNFINLGFSGNAKMETEVANLVSDLSMDALILDCVPNPSPEEVLARTTNFVTTIRKKHPKIPIIAIQSIAREKGNFDTQVASRVSLKNNYFETEIKKLQKHDQNLYLIYADGLLGDDQEGTTDGIHPNDLGFDRMLHKVRPMILKIFRSYEI
ncbi:SGNH/GDSL hydrolase family protein [Olivibacter domesticus]|uniref:Lysophospholipase L1 n=1 Tax=Olivibacter domesticus TaxID=407022 RepID=A0A1H7UEN5_OLID1|nr:SGNH/GDSL hydrolase family protein [Olivibacter domesticus]SEL95175.1 Lysophospholipase L1 [Olivibacter domesticus]